MSCTFCSEPHTTSRMIGDSELTLAHCDNKQCLSSYKETDLLLKRLGPFIMKEWKKCVILRSNGDINDTDWEAAGVQKSKGVLRVAIVHMHTAQQKFPRLETFLKWQELAQKS